MEEEGEEEEEEGAPKSRAAALAPPPKSRSGSRGGSSKTAPRGKSSELEDEPLFEVVQMIICDGCERDYELAHTGLKSIPRGKWHCDECIAERLNTARQRLKAATADVRKSASGPARKKGKNSAASAAVAKESDSASDESDSAEDERIAKELNRLGDAARQKLRAALAAADRTSASGPARKKGKQSTRC